MRKLLLAVLAGTLLVPAGIHAQAVRGRVVDAGSGAPIAGAAVRLLPAAGGAPTSTVTDSTGAFYVAGTGPGTYRLEAGRLGYESVTTDTLRLVSREAVEVVLRLAVQAIPLEPLRIVARVPDARHAATHDGFRARHESAPAVGPVRVVDRDDPEFRNSIYLADILQKFVPDRGCHTLYWDGHMVLTPAMDSVRMEAPLVGVLGVEFYKYEYEAPIELRQSNPALNNQVFAAQGGSANCSIVAVWTRDGEGAARAAAAEPPPALPVTAAMGADITFRPPAAGEPPGVLTGTVSAAGAPAGLAVVELVGPRGERFAITRADEAGAFRLEAPGPGAYVLRAVHDTLGAATSDAFDLPAGRGADVVLRLGGG